LYCIVCISEKYRYAILFYRVLVLFTGFSSLFRNKSVCFGCFETDPNTETNRNKPKQTKTNRNKPKQTETNRKNMLLVSRNKPKINRNRGCFGLFRFEPKKNLVVSRTPYYRRSAEKQK
jgi:hypothetical protein